MQEEHACGNIKNQPVCAYVVCVCKKTRRNYSLKFGIIIACDLHTPVALLHRVHLTFTVPFVRRYGLVHLADDIIY